MPKSVAEKHIVTLYLWQAFTPAKITRSACRFVFNECLMVSNGIYIFNFHNDYIPYLVLLIYIDMLQFDYMINYNQSAPEHV